MTRILFAILTLAVVISAAMLTPAYTLAAGGGPEPVAGQYYLSLGDSLAFGFQESKLNTLLAQGGTPQASAFNTGYSDDFYKMLRAVRPDIQLVNYGCPGETTASFMVGWCSYPFPLHDSYGGSQLDAAVTFLKAHPGQVSPITVSLGTNDVTALTRQCGGLGNVICIAPNLPAVLRTLGSNLAAIIGKLRAAAPNAQVVVIGPYNPHATVDATTNVLDMATNVQFVELFPAFNATLPQPVTQCAVTNTCTALQDTHPSDLGYLTMAQVLWNSSPTLMAALPGFMVSFLSASPGRGMVYFGSGPGCFGLVEVATRDLGAGSTVHVVPVTGNELPGTVGNNGIISGVTYWYEGVTVSSNATAIDNNGGRCYSSSGARS